MVISKAGPEGLVLQIQRMSTEDGPGLRTSAFLKGCPLACAWCHNPEGIDARQELQWVGSRCIAATTADGCGACIRACPKGALSRDTSARAGHSRGDLGDLRVDRARCAGEGGIGTCGGATSAACVDACPGAAMELLGTAYTAEALARELLKDRAWFARSERGGVTLSGGEASAQGAFTLEVLRRCREAGAHTALDTCGVAAWDLLAGLYAETDLVLYDLKEADPARHKAHTGLDNRIVFRNLERTAALMREFPMPRALWIRTPIIPGATDREENLFELGRLLADLAPPRFERWELCAFNNLCADKYRRLGKEWEYARAPLMTAEAMEGLVEAARRGSGGTVIVSWTGSVRIEAERTLQC